MEVSDTTIEIDEEDFSLNLFQPNAQGRGKPDHISIMFDDIPAVIAVMQKLHRDNQ